MAPGNIRIGISGWTYQGWRKHFYPVDLPHQAELSFAAQKFPSIEVNGTFYKLQRPAVFTRWAAETPDDFVFSVKGPRYITHLLRLKEAYQPLANFFASGVLRLGAKLGPILWQFPPRQKFDPARFSTFLNLLPQTASQASRLARRHDTQSTAFTHRGADFPLRYAIEIRHDSFCVPEFLDLLREHKVAFVCADTVEWPLFMDVTTDFVSCRLHGSKQLYTSGYDDDELRRWARRIRSWSKGQEPRDAMRISSRRRPAQHGRDVFVYFDNDAKVRAPIDAAQLRKFLTR